MNEPFIKPPARR